MSETLVVADAPVTEQHRYQLALRWWQERVVELEAKKIESLKRGEEWSDGEEKLIQIAVEYCGLYVRRLLEMNAA